MEEAHNLLNEFVKKRFATQEEKSKLGPALKLITSGPFSSDAVAKYYEINPKTLAYYLFINKIGFFYDRQREFFKLAQIFKSGKNEIICI
jgi:hypothetical protein